MISFPSGALLVAGLLAGVADAAEPSSILHCASTSRFDVAADSLEVAPDVCVSADEPTTFFFDSRVAVGAVEFQPEDRLVDWSQGKGGVSITVIPSEDYLVDERIRMTVRFVDATLPASASFWLVGHAERGTRRVEVYRQPRPADAFRREAADAQAEARQCREEKAQLLSERNEPGGLMGAVWLGQEGTVTSKEITRVKMHPGSELQFLLGTAYSYTRIGGIHAVSLSVYLRLLNPSDKPWTTVGATLMDSTGEQVSLEAFQPAPIIAGSQGNVVVGTEKEPGQLACPCTVKLWEEPGKRVVTLGNITFPNDPKAGHFAHP